MSLGIREKLEPDKYNLLNDLPIPVQIIDCSGRVKFCNDAFLTLVGAAESAIIGSNVWDNEVTSKARNSARKYFEYLMNNRPLPAPYISQFRGVDGAIRRTQARWKYLTENDGTLSGIIRMLIDITEETTEKHIALEALVKASSVLLHTLDQEEVLQAAVDAIPTIVNLDTAAVYLVEDQSARLAATVPQLPASFPDELRYAPLLDHPHLKKAIDERSPCVVRDLLSEDLTEAERNVVDIRELRTVIYVPLVADGRSIGAFIASSQHRKVSLSDMDVQSVNTLANISALAVQNAQLHQESLSYAKKLEESLLEVERTKQQQKSTQKQLYEAQKMESIARLAGGIAHDFNNMLSVIIGNAELALSAADQDLPSRKELEEIRNAANRSAQLTQQLLAFSRRQPSSTRVVSVNDSIEQSLAMLERLVEETIELEWIPDKNAGAVEIDSVHIDQILMNLCVNARDAMEGTGKITVRTSKKTIKANEDQPHYAAGTYSTIEVSDTGCGIDNSVLGAIFEPFFTTKGDLEGTGLGLATVYGIARQYGGFITVDTEIDVGSTFTVFLPSSGRPSAVEEKPSVAHAKSKAGGTILLVDDEPMVARVAKKILESIGLNVVVADSPRKALEIADSLTEPPDLLISDMVMPGMNGLELAAQLKAKSPEIKILLMSGYIREGLYGESISQDTYEVLAKPFEQSELLNKVCEILDLEK